MNTNVCVVLAECRCGIYFTWLRETLYVRRLYQSEWFRERHELHKACVCLLDVLLSLCIGAVAYAILLFVGYPVAWLFKSHMPTETYTLWIFTMAPFFGLCVLLLLTLGTLLTCLLHGCYIRMDNTTPKCVSDTGATRHASTDDCTEVPLLTADTDTSDTIEATFESPLHLSQ
jgi:hypothetical protein